MDKNHSDQLKYEAISMSEGVKTEEVTEVEIPKEDHFVVQQTWNFPQTGLAVPVHHTEPKKETSDVAEVHQSSKKRKFVKSDLEELFDDNQ